MLRNRARAKAKVKTKRKRTPRASQKGDPTRAAGSKPRHRHHQTLADFVGENIGTGTVPTIDPRQGTIKASIAFTQRALWGPHGQQATTLAKSTSNEPKDRLEREDHRHRQRTDRASMLTTGPLNQENYRHEVKEQPTRKGRQALGSIQMTFSHRVLSRYQTTTYPTGKN
jgi:hypothetical protein